MPRISERFRPLMTSGTAGDATITRSEIAAASDAASTEELRALASQAVDAFASPDALGVLTARLGATAVQAPLSSLDDQAASRRWREGGLSLRRGVTGEVKDAVKLLQRALVKIGAHHPEGRARPELMQMPWGADGALGPATARAINAALELGGRADLATITQDSVIGADVAEVIESLLAQTPRVSLPQAVQPPAPTPPARPTGGLFGYVPVPLARLTAFEAKWTGVLARIDAEKPGYRLDNPNLNPAAKYWLDGLADMEGRDRRYQLNAVNTLMNGWVYVTDDENYGGDKWASPLEFFARRGDCEDYAIAKYVSLMRLGFPEESMRIVVVLDRQSENRAHAVLAVDLDDKTYILDNQNSQVLPDNEVVRYPELDARYLPLASMNRDNRFIYGRPT